MRDNLFIFFKRLAIDIVIIGSLLQGWWFVALPFGIIICWFFAFPIELILAGFIYDSLFGVGRDLGTYGYLGTIVSTSITCIIIILKKVIR